MPEIPENSPTTEFMIQYRAAQRDLQAAYASKDLKLVMTAARRFLHDGRVGVAFTAMWGEQTHGGRRA